MLLRSARRRPEYLVCSLVHLTWSLLKVTSVLATQLNRDYNSEKSWLSTIKPFSLNLAKPVFCSNLRVLSLSISECSLHELWHFDYEMVQIWRGTLADEKYFILIKHGENESWFSLMKIYKISIKVCPNYNKQEEQKS